MIFLSRTRCEFQVVTLFVVDTQLIFTYLVQKDGSFTLCTMIDARDSRARRGFTSGLFSLATFLLEVEVVLEG